MRKIKYLFTIVVVTTFVMQLSYGQITGSGTTNYVPKFIGPLVIGNSALYDLSGKIGLGIINPEAGLHIQGASYSELIKWQEIVGGTEAYNASPTAGIIFRNKYNSSGGVAGMGGIAVGKENTTDGNYSGFLTLYTRPNGLSIAERMRITSSGFVGIGTNNPSQKLDVNGNIMVQGGSVLVAQNTGMRKVSRTYGYDIAFDVGGQGATETPLYIAYMNGNVLINKTSQVNPLYKLDVAGGIRADSIVVNSDGSDFVFDENYKLTNLNELEKYITKEKHLPDIQSAAEMQKEGVSVGALQTKLLQKVEELTLYVIEQNKRIEKLEKENEEFRKK